jgi:hypothetical protein
MLAHNLIGGCVKQLLQKVVVIHYASMPGNFSIPRNCICIMCVSVCVNFLQLQVSMNIVSMYNYVHLLKLLWRFEN